MNINKLIDFLRCPYCLSDALSLDSNKIICVGCGASFDVIEDVPIMMKKENLCRQETSQREWFNRHYSEFSKEEYTLENWRLSMLERIFGVSFKASVSRYLDIGCGATGYTVIEAAKRNGWCSFGADISIEAMRRAQHLAKKQGVGDLTGFVVCSAQNLPFKPQSLDYVSAISVLEHIEDDRKVIQGLYNITADNGYAYICVPNTYRRIWPFLWPVYLYLDHKIGHKRHYSIEALNEKMGANNCFELEKVFYNGHLIKLWQLVLDKFKLVDNGCWWKMEKKDINQCARGVQLNAIYRRK